MASTYIIIGRTASKAARINTGLSSRTITTRITATKTAAQIMIRPVSTSTSATAVTNNTEGSVPVVPRHRCSPGLQLQRCYSTSTMTLKNDSKEGDNGVKVSHTKAQASQSKSPLSSPLSMNAKSTTTSRRKGRKFIPRKAAVKLTEKARTLFQKLLENHPTRDGILLNYNQSSTGEPRMVFSFSFVSNDELDDQDEGVSLEVDEEGNPKSPRDTLDDGLPKLYVHHNAFLKVLGATVDVDTENITPVLFDKEGFKMDANL